MKINKLAALASASEEELNRGNWRIVSYALEKVRAEFDEITGVRHSWIDPAINIAKENANLPLSTVVPPQYTSAIGEAAERYLSSFPYAMPLPAQFRWEEMWAAMNVAMLGPKLSQGQFVELQRELEGLEQDIALGQDTDEGDRRIREIEALMQSSRWELHPDHGVLPKELASTDEVFQALVSLGIDASMGLAVETMGRLDREALADLYVSSNGQNDWLSRLASYIGENELHKEPAPKFSLPGVWEEVDKDIYVRYFANTESFIEAKIKWAENRVNLSGKAVGIVGGVMKAAMSVVDAAANLDDADQVREKVDSVEHQLGAYLRKHASLNDNAPSPSL